MSYQWRNDELEGAVLGAMFLRGADPEVLDVISRLPASAFNVKQYRDIYSGICTQARANGVIDPVLLSDSMPQYAAIITETGRRAWAKSSFSAYVETLIGNAAIRDGEAAVMKVLADIRASNTPEAAAAALAGARQVMSTIDAGAGIIQAVSIDDYLPEVVSRVEETMANGGAGRFLRTGIEELDAMTGGLDLTDLVFIAARPSMGKTELVLDIIDKVTEQGHGVLFFSMEMAGIQITERMVSAAGGLPVSRLKSAQQFEDEDWARLSAGVGRLTGRPIWIVDATNLNVDQICQTATRMQVEHPEIALVAVDYLGLIKVMGSGRHDLAVGDISKGLKRLAKSNKTPVVALSQLSRGVEQRPNKRPMNSDMKNSGEIEADADLILMLYRDEVYNPESPARAIAEISITKQRNGALGTIYRRFYNGHFHPIDQEAARQLSAPKQQTNQRRYANA
ncbi:DnaB-like helicase C-terminal domain-containing protein [Kluyvera intermedia]|uniref:replicative DNA helicase n=1 Tax=Kluyvera intermedia TaxID=61648 RepID=UPI0007894225|nr:replicative DNA helicase [Kluyvera intermedia]WQD31486.1 DnaB-like helicase C-terminal domain-containing protein [Kluyvera intermedia]VDZ82818.1 Replicative DNA helicase [Kluyvera intermedia]